MYNEQLENLIEMGLTDGQLTEKEKQILFKKAESLGVDLDEFEMVLDAKLYEKQQSIKNTQPITPGAAPQSNKFGDVKKCPACGALIQSYNTKCSDCGHEFSSIAANVSIQTLFKALDDVEAKREDEPERGLLGTYGALLAKGTGLGITDKTTNRKRGIIANFPIPTTKDDIIEFLTLAIPMAKTKGNLFTKDLEENKSHNDLTGTWKSKCEQIILKARFAMKEDRKTLDEIIALGKEIGIK